MDSTNPAEFEAYLAQFPNGVFRALAEARLAELRAPANSVPGETGSRRADAAGSPGSGSRTADGTDAPRRPGEVFRDCGECPEMVVMPGGGLALGRYEVTVGEYRAFASETGGGAGDRCLDFRGLLDRGFRDNGNSSWRDPSFPQTERHPVTCMNWDDAQAYVSWLSRTTGETYRLPTEAEWERGAAGSAPGCYQDRTGNEGTCPVGSYGSNAAGLLDMVGNLEEWTEDCDEGIFGCAGARVQSRRQLGIPPLDPASRHAQLSLPRRPLQPLRFPRGEGARLVLESSGLHLLGSGGRRPPAKPGRK